MKHLTILSLILLLTVFACNDPESNDSFTDESESAVMTKTGLSNSGLTREIGSAIPSETAERWIRNYTDKNPDGIKSHFYGSELFQTILKNPDCVGIRLMHALKDDGTTQILLVGVDSEGNALSQAPDEIGRTSSDEIYYDQGMLCPPTCN